MAACREGCIVANAVAEILGVGVHSSGKGKKNGVPPYTNLVNLKSNTMKNTLQRYDKFHFLQIFYIKNGVKNTFS